MAAMTLLSVGMMTLTSCKDETSQSEKNISIRLEEVGYENSKMVIAGKDLHVEAHVLADAKIKSINIDLVDKVGKTVLSKEYKDEKYTYVLNTTFHEHIDIPANLPEGNYELRFTVTDVDNFSKTEKVMVKVLTFDPNAPKIDNYVVNGDVHTAKAGSKIMVTADVTVQSPVKEIEVEFHGKREFPIEIEGYEGKTGTFKVVAEVTVPADAEEGEYHVHFTVTDNKGRASTGELEGFKITK